MTARHRIGRRSFLKGAAAVAAGGLAAPWAAPSSALGSA
ncbi:MAG: twin-arginine translocation signal domain-containing protein, partial [Planctomycetes bacterium]|nr:twin-arginine translocation signal domain-containing protein [Planctomycetota bacterium]